MQANAATVKTRGLPPIMWRGGWVPASQWRDHALNPSPVVAHLPASASPRSGLATASDWSLAIVVSPAVARVAFFVQLWQASIMASQVATPRWPIGGGRAARGNDPAARQDLAHVVEHDHAVAQQAPPLLRVDSDSVGGVTVRTVSRRARGAVSTHCAPLVWAADVPGRGPGRLGWSCKDGTNQRSLWASPDGAHAGGIFHSRPVGTTVPPASAAGTAGIIRSGGPGDGPQARRVIAWALGRRGRADMCAAGPPDRCTACRCRRRSARLPGLAIGSLGRPGCRGGPGARHRRGGAGPGRTGVVAASASAA